jgi:hypothetical protein
MASIPYSPLAGAAVWGVFSGDSRGDLFGVSERLPERDGDGGI